MDPITVAYGAGVVGILAALGKWVIPFMGRMFDTATTGVQASGDLLKAIVAERDHWKAHAEKLDGTLQELRGDFAKLQSKFDIMEFQFTEAMKELRRYREVTDGPNREVV